MPGLGDVMAGPGARGMPGRDGGGRGRRRNGRTRCAGRPPHRRVRRPREPSDARWCGSRPGRPGCRRRRRGGHIGAGPARHRAHRRRIAPEHPIPGPPGDRVRLHGQVLAGVLAHGGSLPERGPGRDASPVRRGARTGESPPSRTRARSCRDVPDAAGPGTLCRGLRCGSRRTVSPSAAWSRARPASRRGAFFHQKRTKCRGLLRQCQPVRKVGPSASAHAWIDPAPASRRGSGHGRPSRRWTPTPYGLRWARSRSRVGWRRTGSPPRSARRTRCAGKRRSPCSWSAGSSAAICWSTCRST